MEVRQFFIPSIGTEITLEEDWTFNLYKEGRNNPLWEAKLGEKLSYLNSAEEFREVTLEKGITLAVRRIYIRQQMSEYDSITFSIVDVPDGVSKKLRKKRFWAKLGDVNKIKYSVEGNAPSSDGLLFLMRKTDRGFVRVRLSRQSKFFDLNNAVKKLKEDEFSADLSIYRAPAGTRLPKTVSKRKLKRNPSQVQFHSRQEVQDTYELVYESQGPLGKGPEVEFRRVRWVPEHQYQPSNPCDFFREDTARAHIKEADSIYSLVDDARSGSKYGSDAARAAVVYRVGGKWFGRLTGELRYLAPKLQERFCDLHSEGLGEFRTLKEGIGFFRDFFEEYLEDYAPYIQEARDTIVQYQRKGKYNKSATS